MQEIVARSLDSFGALPGFAVLMSLQTVQACDRL